MDLENWYNSKNETTKIYLKSVKESFQLDSNIYRLSQIIYRKLYSTNNENKYEEIKSKVKIAVNEWVTQGKLDNIEETASFISNEITLQLDYYNDLFITAFTNRIVNLQGGQLNYEINNNPYKQTILSDGKNIKISDMIASDYQNININSYENVYTSNGNFTQKYNQISFYEKAIYNKNIDMKDEGSLRKNISKENISFKRYDNKDLINNVPYLLKK
jgi:hypothetical protein